MLDQITPLIITYNEAANIGRTLRKLSWAQRIVVIDSGSNDGTLETLHAHPRVEVFHRPFVDFASQCNFGIAKIATPWVLSLDADYELSDSVITEMQSLSPDDAVVGYQCRFIYRIYGRALRGSLYPPRVVLYRANNAFYEMDGHGHRVRVVGDIRPLHGFIYHDDRKPISRWYFSQQKYAREEAEYLLVTSHGNLRAIDKLRAAAWPAPLLIFAYTLLVKRALLDGWPGWYYALQRLLAEVLLAIEILDRRLRSDDRQ